MKKQNKQLTLQQHYDSVPIDAKPQIHHASGHKGKLAGLNQSMDAGINNYSQSMGNIPPAQQDQLQKIQASGRMETDEQQYHQNYINKSFDVGGPGSGQMKPGHHRGGSHAVGQPQQLHKQAGKKSQGQFASINQYDHHGQLSQAQIAQMNRLQQQNNLIEQQQMVQQNPNYQVQAYGDRQQQQKSKRKHNLSQNMPKSNEYGQNGGGQGMISNNNTQSAGMVQKLQNHPQFGTEAQQMSSKRSYENTNMEKKANRSSKQKFLAPNIHNSSQVQYNQNPGGNMYETARYNSIGSLHYPQGGVTNGSSLILTQPSNGQSKERFQGTQKIGKKTKISGQGGSIILPAGSSLQNVPQLKPHLSKGGHQTHSSKNSGQQLPNHHSQPHFGGPQTHQRMHSLQDSSSVGANMQRGFNSASNAAMQQQAQIVQIYQQPNSVSGHGSSMQKMKYQGNQSNNSRKMIPMLQGGQQNQQQPVSHHKRTSQLQQMSRDRDQHANSLLVDSYSSNNYQTYSQNYDPGHLQEGSQRKQHLADANTGRANRVASREQSSRRALVQGELSNIKVNQSEMNQMKAGTHGMIPQKHKKSQQSSKMGNNQSLQDIGNHHSLNQTTTQGFFEQSTNPSGMLNSSGHLNQTSQKGSSKTSTGGMKHGKTASQYTPQMTQSLKHTIPQQNHGQMQGQHMNPEGAMLLQTKKSGPVASQSHMRQNSVQVAVDFRGQDKKISIQHRKNKSVLSNQIRINPQLQNQQNGGGHQGQKLRVSHDNTAGKQKINQYFDNYTDQAQANFYMQQMNNTTGSNLSLTQQNPHQYQQASNLSSASLKHNLSQSTHRKNKTSVIGGQQKMLGINSSTAFPHPSKIPANLMDNASNSSMKKIIGGTISHSHKSLRSQSSSRKRVASIDSSAGPNHLHGQSQKYNLPMGPDGKKIPQGHSGHLTPDLSSYSNGNNGNQIHQMKAQKILKNQTGSQFRQQLKPQGNIVIQQQPSTSSQSTSQHHQNLKSSQGNRRHSSILKGEHQNKQTIFIDQSQGQAARYVHGGPAPNNQHNFGAMSPDLEEQASLGSVDVSSVRAINNVFQDGGTGGGIQKPANQKMTKDYKGANKNSYTDKKGSAAKHGRLDSSSEDYNMVQGAGGSATKLKSNRIQNNQELVDIDDADIGVGVPNVQPQAEKPSRKKRQNQGGISSSSDVMKQQAYSDGQMRGGPDMEFDFSDSINITKEALAIGKVCPEQVAQFIADSGHTLDPSDRTLSPRTREIVHISNKIRKSFLAKGDAPKTTPDFYRAGKMLGRGAFGKVSLGMHRLSRKLVALKSINKEFMSDDKQKSKIMHEVGILLRLRHCSVVKLYETFETKRHMLLTMELCAGGDLLNYVRKRKKLDEDVARVIFKQIIEGLGYIHRKRVLHRDIKLDNILLDGKGNVKIADFGVSKLVKPGDIMHEQSGTPAYIAPEILKEEGYMGFKADIWSAGVVFYAMLCGTVPFKASNMKELHKMIIKGKYNLKEEISEDAQNLLRAMLETDPKKRISVQKILAHKWLQLPEGEEECEIFNAEERQIVQREFIYNNPKQINRSEKINQDEEPWDCFTELNLDSVDEQLRNESEKSVILAPFNSSISDFDEEEYKGMDASLIIHRLFDDAAPLQEKKATVRFAARCRDQDRQYEINNNGDLDNGVYHKFVYSSRDGGPDPSSSMDDAKGGSVNDLRPQSSRNDTRKSRDLKNEIDRRVREAKRQESDATSECDYGAESSESMHGIGGPGGGPILDAARVQTMVNFGYPEEYVRYCLLENEACYCLSAYFLLGEDQIYQ